MVMKKVMIFSLKSTGLKDIFSEETIWGPRDALCQNLKNSQGDQGRIFDFKIF